MSLRRSLAIWPFILVLGGGPVLAQDTSTDAVEVTGVEYAFVGLPASVPVGTPFRLVNGGKEDHEFAVVRRNEGTTETLDELLALPQPELFSKVTFAGVVFAPVGQTSLATLTLDQPGAYVAVCFVAQGTASGSPPGPAEPGASPAGSPGASPGGAQGPPHVVLGMRGEFTVGGPETSPGPRSTPVP
jgi:hypothetical protein